MYSPARRRFFTVVALATAALAIYLLWPVVLHIAAQAIIASGALKPSKAAPDFTLNDASGGRLRLADYKGKVVLLNFWATWCGPCKVEIPWFIEFQKKYQARGFTVLGVSMDEEGWKVINPYVAAEKINYPIVLGDEKVNLLYGGIEALPTTFLIDRNGDVAHLHTGLVSKTDYEKEILQLLTSAKGAVSRRHAMKELSIEVARTRPVLRVFLKNAANTHAAPSVSLWLPIRFPRSLANR